MAERGVRVAVEDHWAREAMAVTELVTDGVGVAVDDSGPSIASVEGVALMANRPTIVDRVA